METLLVLVIAAAAVVLLLGLVVLLGNPERQDRPAYPDRRASPEVRERQDSLEPPAAEWEERIMTRDTETSRAEDGIPTTQAKAGGRGKGRTSKEPKK